MRGEEKCSGGHVQVALRPNDTVLPGSITDWIAPSALSSGSRSSKRSESSRPQSPAGL